MSCSCLRSPRWHKSIAHDAVFVRLDTVPECRRATGSDGATDRQQVYICSLRKSTVPSRQSTCAIKKRTPRGEEEIETQSQIRHVSSRILFPAVPSRRINSSRCKAARGRVSIARRLAGALIPSPLPALALIYLVCIHEVNLLVASLHDDLVLKHSALSTASLALQCHAPCQCCSHLHREPHAS